MDGKIQARRNENKILRALHRFGWLRAKDLAVLCWTAWQTATNAPPNLAACHVRESSLRMAQRTLRRMVERRRTVLKAAAPDGSVIYALAECGARVLREQGVRDAKSGKDLIRTFSPGHYRHRVIANEIAITAIVQGYRVSSEREVSQGRWLGGKEGIWRKLPDTLIRSGDSLWWVEVERSRKNQRDYQHLISWLTVVADLSDTKAQWPDDARVVKVVFICSHAFRQRLRADLVAHGWKNNYIEDVILFESSLYNNIGQTIVL